MNTKPAASTATAQDPSMEEILASIRRILSEDETSAAAVEPAPHADHAHAVGAIETAAEAPVDDILDLDPGMLVTAHAPAPEPAMAVAPAPARAPDPFDDLPDPPPPAPEPAAALPTEIAPSHDATDAMEPDLNAPFADPPIAPPHLVAPEAAAAAAVSVGSLVRTLVAERATAVHRGGPTIEDLVREEVRPLLKDWLDTHLPPMVERLVRAEIERVVSRTQI
jgi:cell pole-organizing protein PopZ